MKHRFAGATTTLQSCDHTIHRNAGKNGEGNRKWKGRFLPFDNNIGLVLLKQAKHILEYNSPVFSGET